MWKSTSNPYAASKTALRKLWEKRLFSSCQFTKAAAGQDTANTISLRRALFPAMKDGNARKTVRQKAKKFMVVPRFPRFPQGVEKTAWKTKAFLFKALRQLLTFCPRGYPRRT